MTASLACHVAGRFAVFAIAFVACALPLRVEAQQAGRVSRIGFLGASSPSAQPANLEALRAGLRDLGYVDGKDIVIEYRWAEGKYDRLGALAAELVRLKVDVLVTGGTASIRAAKQSTTTTPIVMTSSGDAVSTGLVDSLARPGGNVTGITFFVPELMAKRLDLLKEAVPRIRRTAVLVNPDDPSHVPVLTTMEMAARALKVELHKFEARGPSEFISVFAAMTKIPVDALVVQEDALFIGNAKAIADLAMKNQLAAAGHAAFADAGGQIGYGPSFPDMFRRTAYFVDKILKGTKPYDLPVERPTKFEFVINGRTAKALGLTLPPSLQLRADRVIE